MTKEFSFDIAFEKFNDKKRIDLNIGLNVFYGESGSGKTELINSFLGNKNFETKNFIITSKKIPEKMQLVFQNPENQIVCPNLLSEISFGLESQPYNDDLLSSLKDLKALLPFIDNWSRHPNTLSGGEMEILNIVTAFSYPSEVIFIDDGLSYLNSSIKNDWVNWINEKYGEQKTILWFTSDHTDLKYGNTKWILSLSGLQKINKSKLSTSYNHQHISGSLSIKTDDLTFSFNDSKKSVIEKLNIELSNSRSLGIIGKNGSGKTTLIKLLTNEVNPSNGKIDLKLGDESPSIAVLNQFPERMLGPNTLEQLLQKMIDNNKFEKNKLKSFIKKLNSHQVNWDKVKHKKAFDLSWSIVRIVLILILALSNFKLIILDEPTFGLGFQQKIKLSQIIKSLLVNKHLILVSHDTNFINNHCDQIIDFDSKTILQNNKILSNAE